jgi:hypothetical protein
MTPGRHVPTTLLAILVFFLLLAFGACIVLLNPGRERPADVTPTPYAPTVVVVDPTRPVAVPPPPAVPTPERLLMTPVVVPAYTKTPTPTPSPAPTKKPMTEKVERG